ncbi:hypothetical protein AMTR_s00087p00068100, partial [Amborella trichopoda]
DCTIADSDETQGDHLIWSPTSRRALSDFESATLAQWLIFPRLLWALRSKGLDAVVPNPLQFFLGGLLLCNCSAFPAAYLVLPPNLVVFSGEFQFLALRIQISRLLWSPPIMGSLKLNVDGCFFRNLGPLGYGGSLASHEGQILSFLGRPEHIGSALVESMAILEGLTCLLPIPSGVDSIIMKGDFWPIWKAENASLEDASPGR